MPTEVHDVVLPTGWTNPPQLARRMLSPDSVVPREDLLVTVPPNVGIYAADDQRVAEDRHSQFCHPSKLEDLVGVDAPRDVPDVLRRLLLEVFGDVAGESPAATDAVGLDVVDHLVAREFGGAELQHHFVVSVLHALAGPAVPLLPYLLLVHESP